MLSNIRIKTKVYATTLISSMAFRYINNEGMSLKRLIIAQILMGIAHAARIVIRSSVVKRLLISLTAFIPDSIYIRSTFVCVYKL